MFLQFSSFVYFSVRSFIYCIFADRVSSSKRFCNELQKAKKDLKIGEYIVLPKFDLLSQTERVRFPMQISSVNMMHRKVTMDMEEFIKAHIGYPAVYVQGPRGVGKSFSLFEIVCRFRSDPKKRVIYVPDCAGWGVFSDEEAVEFLLYAIILAFSDDEEVLTLCRSDRIKEEKATKALLLVRKFYFHLL